MCHINLDLVRVTETTAISASAWIGSGDKISADAGCDSSDAESAQ